MYYEYIKYLKLDKHIVLALEPVALLLTRIAGRIWTDIILQAGILVWLNTKPSKLLASMIVTDKVVTCCKNLRSSLD
jgi:hypothetical protein